MGQVRNLLFIMCDQLRFDYLGCTGHPTIATPNIDALAARGVLFSRAYCASPICGPSRMSFYTGRYMVSHGSTWNLVPLSVGEMTMGDYLRPLGLRTVLIGKTHMRADLEGMARLGIDPASDLGILVSECGFEPVERDDGMHPDLINDPDLAYNRYLRELGYEGDNPWQDYANSAEGPDGEILSGWLLRHANLPARVAEKHSETAYMTNRAIDFIRQAGGDPWCLHLSYVKPHWPYMAPAPYHRMYGSNQILPAVRSERERQAPHPVHGAFMQNDDSRSFQREEVRQRVIPTYMGLISQIDTHIGRLMASLEAEGRTDDTLIVFTSDHGDYLGDHWLGEKDLMYEPSARIPLIVYDPDPAAEVSRGRVDPRFAEGIDVLPTFLDALGAEIPDHRLEGRSLLSLTRAGDGESPDWRQAVFCEAEYGVRKARHILAVPPKAARGFMIREERWKYLLWEGFRPQLFDLEGDPGELLDLGESPEHAGVRADMHERLFEWLRARPIRVTASEAAIARRTGRSKELTGVVIGEW